MNAPRCPIHVGTAMMLVEQKVPSFVALSDPGTLHRARKARRKVWRCPIAGCPRVHLYEEADRASERPPCPLCGKPTDAPGYLRSRSQHACRACSKERKQRYNRQAAQGVAA